MRQPGTVQLLLACLMMSAPALLAQTKPANTPITSASPAVSPALAASAPAPAAALANPKTPAEFFARARQLSDLEAAGIPFHLKAAFVATGDKEYTGNGTYEEWWQNADNWRMEAAFGDFHLVSMDTPAGPRLYASSWDIPTAVFDAMGNVLVRIAQDAGTTSDWHIKQKKIHGVKLTRSSMKPHRKPDGGFVQGHNDFFSSNGLLRIEKSVNKTTEYDAFQQFQTQLVPRTVQVESGHGNLLKISIDTLEPLQVNAKSAAKLGAAPGELPLLGNLVLADSGAMAAHILHRYLVPPRYPVAAKAQRIQGTVVFAVVIGDSGTIRYLRAVKSPNNLLTEAAYDAVRQWRYEPTIQDGKPVAVYTKITVIFTMDE